MAASYPTSIKSFTTLFDQPHTAPPPPTRDPSIDFSVWTNEIHDEVVAIENEIGARPFTIPPTLTIGGSVTWMYQNLASISHTHQHGDLLGRESDDHPLYVRTDGTRGFTQPVAGQWAWNGAQLTTLGQVGGAGYINQAQFLNQLEGWLNALGREVVGVDLGLPIWGPQSFTGAFKIQGGSAYGYTDPNGILFVPFNPPFLYQVQTFCFMRLPIPGGSHFGYVYQFVEDQLVPQRLDRFGAAILFIEDIAIDRRAWVGMSWIAMGV